MRIIDGNYECNLRGSYNEKIILCAFDELNYSNICNGDSGGPLIYYEDGKWFIHGLTSYSLSDPFGGCSLRDPAFFTKVSQFTKWIDEVQGKNFVPSSIKKDQKFQVFAFLIINFILFRLLF